MTLEENLVLIVQEIKKANSEKFTGNLTLTLAMRSGGVGNISVLLEKNLKK